MTVSVIAALPVGGINIAAASSASIGTSLIGQLDLALFGSFGLGSISSDLSLQFSAAIDAEVQIGLQVSDPTAALLALANLLASLSIGLPTINLQANAALSANIASAAAISAQLGGINALIEAATAAKAPAVSLFSNIAAAVTAGPLFLVNVTETGVGGLAQAGADLATLFSSGIVSGGDSIAPGDPVYGVVLLTSSPSVFAALGTILKVQ